MAHMRKTYESHCRQVEAQGTFSGVAFFIYHHCPLLPTMSHLETRTSITEVSWGALSKELASLNRSAIKGAFETESCILAFILFFMLVKTRFKKAASLKDGHTSHCHSLGVTQLH